jgi:hypothetical protein
MTASGGEEGRARQPGLFVRLVRAWNQLPGERRLASLAALGLVVTLFLPWYQETVIASGGSALRSASASLTGWGAFSFVEAALLLVAGGVLVLLFVRAEGAAFHVPGGDGGVITAAGLWACVLILWRLFDKEGTTVHGQYTTTSGIEWGIFFALGVAGLLAYAGVQIRRAHEPEPPLPGESEAQTPRRRLRRALRGRGSAPPTTPSPRASNVRTPDMEADETWVQQPQAPRQASPGAPRRKRPATGAELDPREIHDLDLAEPPTLHTPDEAPPTLRTRDDDPPTVPTRDDEPPTIRTRDDEPSTVPTRHDDPDTTPLPPDHRTSAGPRRQ